MTATATLTPRETDTALAELYTELYRQHDRLDVLERNAQQQAGATFHYRGRQRVTDTTVGEALATLRADVAAHAHEADDDYGYTLIRGGTSIGSIRTTLERHAETAAAIADLDRRIDELEATYTGWPRYFLVTSSQGHIHSTMSCHTCRPTTRYGWLPSLSGQDEEQAVAAHGPALCSVCFPSAPVEWTEAKIGKRAAEAAAH